MIGKDGPKSLDELKKMATAHFFVMQIESEFYDFESNFVQMVGRCKCIFLTCFSKKGKVMPLSLVITTNVTATTSLTMTSPSVLQYGISLFLQLSKHL